MAGAFPEFPGLGKGQLHSLLKISFYEGDAENHYFG